MLLRPLRRCALPTVGAQGGVERCGQWTGVAGSEVALDVAQPAHPGDDRADHRVVENETQGHLGHGHPRWEQGGESFGVLYARLQVLWHKIRVAPIALRPLAV